MKLTLLNVKYSQNLGDGIIAECFEHALSQVPSVTKVNSCDLAGREIFDGRSNRIRQITRSLLDRLPPSLRRTLSIAILKQMVSTKLRAHYTEQLRDTDIAIIGGGQLIADAELNFPLKIYEATQAARDAGAAISIYGVGVGHSFSGRGYNLFKSAFEDGLLSVHVRDQRSAKRWLERFGDESIGHVWDPGLLAREVYGRPMRARPVRKRLGIGITHPATLDLHADRKADRMSRSDWIGFYGDLIEYFVARNWEVELFTNGACSDQSFAHQIKLALQRRSGTGILVDVAEAPKTPKKLAHMIADYDTIVAHRLHANIIAFAYGIPHVGLGWDSKMEGFFEATKREKFLISSPCPATVGHIAQTVRDAAVTPIPHHQIASVENEVLQQILSFGEQLAQFHTQQIENLYVQPGQARPARGLKDAKAY